jgi:hypothetical protein
MMSFVDARCKDRDGAREQPAAVILNPATSGLHERASAANQAIANGALIPMADFRATLTV